MNPVRTQNTFGNKYYVEINWSIQSSVVKLRLSEF